MTQTQEKPEYAELDAFIEALNLKFTAEFVPQSRSPEPDNERLSWRTKINNLETPYFQGIGHLPFPVNRRRVLYLDKKIKDACENGYFYTADEFYAGETSVRGKKQYLEPPLLRDVLYASVMDADAINFPSFENWANTYGYNQDSRKAEAIYKACLKQGLALRAMLGDVNLAKLRKLFIDY